MSTPWFQGLTSLVKKDTDSMNEFPALFYIRKDQPEVFSWKGI